MADYVVRFTGLDNLSGTINQINLELREVGGNSSQLDKIMQRFSRIDLSAAPLKKKLRDLQNIMAQMNMDGLSGTDEFTVIALRAGEFKDAMSDASLAVRLYADDTFKLLAGIEAFLGLAAAGSVAAGVMGLLGTENEQVELAILKVQSAMAILNGVLQIANTLNKDSALMLRLKSIWTAATTASTTANTVATTANTGATIANTAALKAWNVTKAIGKALFGDWTGLLLVGAAALGTYAIATSDATEAEDKHSKALNKTADSMNSYSSTMQSTFAQLMTSYTLLKVEWKSLSTELLKNQWIKDNQSKLADLNISVNNVADAERVFSNNTPSVVKAFIARAKAAALLSLLTENYKKQMELIDKINTAQAAQAAEAASRPKVTAGQEIINNQHRNSRYGSVNAQGKWVYSLAGATLNNTGISNTNPVINKWKSALNDLQTESNKIANGIAGTVKDIPTISKPSSTTHSVNNTKPRSVSNTKPHIKVSAPNGSLLAYEDELAKLNKLLKLTPETNTSAIEKLKKDIADITNKKETLEIQLGFKEPKKEDVKEFAEGSRAAIEEEIGKIDARLRNENLDIPARLKLVTDRNELQKLADGLSNVGKSPLEQYRDLAGEIDDVVNLNNAGLINDDKARELIADINERIVALGANPVNIHIETDAEEKLNRITGAVGNMGNAFSSLGQAFEMPELEIAGVIANAIASIIEGYGAASSLAATLGPWAWIAFSIAGLAQVASIISQIHSLSGYADGGIINGSTFHGDAMLARVNAGEMILNPKLLNHLFNVLDGNITNGSGTVEFKIAGSQLKGVLKNYDNKMSKVK